MSMARSCVGAYTVTLGLLVTAMCCGHLESVLASSTVWPSPQSSSRHDWSSPEAMAVLSSSDVLADSSPEDITVLPSVSISELHFVASSNIYVSEAYQSASSLVVLWVSSTSTLLPSQAMSGPVSSYSPPIAVEPSNTFTTSSTADTSPLLASSVSSEYISPGASVLHSSSYALDSSVALEPASSQDVLSTEGSPSPTISVEPSMSIALPKRSSSLVSTAADLRPSAGMGTTVLLSTHEPPPFSYIPAVTATAVDTAVTATAVDTAVGHSSNSAYAPASSDVSVAASSRDRASSVVVPSMSTPEVVSTSVVRVPTMSGKVVTPTSVVPSAATSSGRGGVTTSSGHGGVSPSSPSPTTPSSVSGLTMTQLIIISVTSAAVVLAVVVVVVALCVRYYRQRNAYMPVELSDLLEHEDDDKLIL